ncbi:sterigmatocystin 8-O-methyltransferase [Metarhizium brunneum]
MAGASSTITLIEQLGNLKPTLALQDNQGARQDALRLSKRLVMELGQPPNVVVDLAYSDRLLTGLHGQSAVLVDVGAGKGHDLMAFHEKYAGHSRLVLQDLAAVTDHVKDLSGEIEIMTHDFFTEQPVRGARAYLYHHILHDWSDKRCLEILGKLRGAMLPGYSKLLIHDMVIPERGASTFHAMLDMAHDGL